MNEKSTLVGCFRNSYGCRNRTRTYDPLINSQLLYRLSYAATRLSYTQESETWAENYRP